MAEPNTIPASSDWSTVGDQPSQNQPTQSGTVQGSSDWAPVDKGEPQAPQGSIDPGTGIINTIKGIGQGAGEAFMGTVKGLGDLADKANTAIGSPLPHISPEARQQMEHLSGSDDPNAGDIAHKIGYGGETLLEFLMGDEALKGASYATKLTQAAKTAKILESSPKLMKAAQIGADALRMGTVQTGQTYARTGDIKEAAKEGATMGATAGALGTVGAGVEKVASSLAKGGEAVKNLSEAAANAPSKPQVAADVQAALNTSENNLHQTYETGINDLKDRLGDSEVEVKGSPVSNKATELLKNPDPSEHELVRQAKDVAGDRLDKGVKNMLELAAKGERPVEDTGNTSKIALTDAAGKELPAEAKEPQTEPLKPWTVDDLVDFRQSVRKLAETYDRGDINSRTLKQLLPAVDDTIGKLAEKSGDTKAVSDYAQLRSDYGQKINLYDTPVIKNLQEGKLDDAAKDFLSKANQAQYKADSLRTILGDDEMNKFSHNVFGTMLESAKDNSGNFNPANLMKAWENIPKDTRENFFQPNTVKGQDIQRFMKDAKTAANVQYLSRLGLISGFTAAGAATGGALGSTGVGTILGLLLSSGTAGVPLGREFIDYVANHPKLWSAYRTAGKVVSSPITQNVGSVAKAAAGQALSGANKQNQAKRTVYNGAYGLAGNQ